VLFLDSDRPILVAVNPGGGYFYYSGGAWSPKQLVTGAPVDQIYGYKFLGMWGTDEAAKAAEYGQLPGMIKYQDIPDKEGKIDGNIEIVNDGQEVIGNADPKFYYGWHNNISYKNFNLSFMIQGSYGNDIFNAMRIKLEHERYGLGKNSTDYWTPTNQGAKIPARIGTYELAEFRLSHPNKYSMGNDNRSNRYIESGTYIRLKNITLTYNLPKSLINALPIERLSVYVTGTNLITITDYTGWDPEVSSFNRVLGGNGIDLCNYPTAKVVTFGVNLTF